MKGGAIVIFCIELFHGHMTKSDQSRKLMVNVMTLSCPPYWCSAEIGVCVVDQCFRARGGYYKVGGQINIHMSAIKIVI